MLHTALNVGECKYGGGRQHGTRSGYDSFGFNPLASTALQRQPTAPQTQQ
jgi:hypothetical protein